MGKLILLFFVIAGLLLVQAKKEVKEEAAAPTTASGNSADEEDSAENTEGEGAASNDETANSSEEAKADSNEEGVTKSETAPEEDTGTDEATSDETKEGSEEEDAENTSSSDKLTPEFACNLKFKGVGCYADKSKKEKPLRSFIMTDADLGPTSKKGKLPKGDKFNSELPKFACKCANEAINSGNAIFGIQNIAECWTGPDDSKYDKDGTSMDCVTFDYAPCDTNSPMCAGKKHANYVYYVDTPEHTKSKEDIAREYAEYKEKVAAHEKKKDLKKKAAKKLKKKGKKSKKE